MERLLEILRFAVQGTVTRLANQQHAAMDPTARAENDQLLLIAGVSLVIVFGLAALTNRVFGPFFGPTDVIVRGGAIWAAFALGALLIGVVLLALIGAALFALGAIA